MEMVKLAIFTTWNIHHSLTEKLALLLVKIYKIYISRNLELLEIFLNM